MEYRETYESWLSNPYFDEETKDELRAIADDDKEIKERFYKYGRFVGNRYPAVDYRRCGCLYMESKEERR